MFQPSLGIGHLGGNRALKRAIASKGLFGYHLTAKCFESCGRMGDLPGPPRALSNLGISCLALRGPELAVSGVGTVVSAGADSCVARDFGRVVSGLEIRLLGNGDRCRQERVRMSDDFVLKPGRPT